MRKLATAAAVSLALGSGGAFGLGLGDIEMRSALNQPMQAEIRLTAVKTGEIDGMIVQLASADAFARAGIERSTVLTDLTFEVDRSGPVPLIRISSKQPVAEPFLNFLLEVDWPQGRMIREYTVLLDPPVFMTSTASDRNTAGDQAVVVQRGEEALVVPTPIERGSSIEGEVVDLGLISPPEGELIDLQSLEGGQQFDGQAFQVDGYDASADGEIVSLSDLSAPNTSAAEQFSQGATESFDGFEVEVLGGAQEVDNGSDGFVSEADGSTIVSLDELNSPDPISLNGESVSVNRGDTLFEIARSTAVGGASTQQMMMALLKANESSFINGNINLVKAGATLRVPDASEATRLNQTEALAAISEQNQLWRDYRDQLRSGSGTRLASTDNSTQAVEPLQDVELYSEGDTNETGFADRAQAILDNARDEIREREELKLVADSTSASIAGSATADGASADTDRLGDVNRRLQLAREELSSTRLQSGDLADQASELTNTTENLDSLVELRQTGVANLEAQLADARKNGQDSVDNVGNAIEGVGDSSVDLLADTADSGTNALTEAGEELGEVVPFSEGENQQGAQGDNPLSLQAEIPAEPQPWYKSILSEPLKMLMAAGALLGILGLGALLLWRRRRADDVDEHGAFGDDVDFIDEDEAADLQSELSQDRFGEGEEFDDFGEVGSATVAGSDFTENDSAEQFNHAPSDTHGSSGAGFGVAAAAAGVAASAGYASADDQDLAFGSETQAITGAASNDDVDPDDTISEVDVYLNYGLHGQAEELLNKAVETQPNNPEYARKLLETYHGQRSDEKYLAAAQNFHARFGGESNPDWNNIAADGADLLPDEPLFQNASSSGNTRVGTLDPEFDNRDSKLSDDDFQFDTESGVDSINRSIDATYTDDSSTNLDSDGGFGIKAPAVAAGAAAAAGFASLKSKADSIGFDDDETDLMDQSLDPAFAFDEADLEATGDFSQITDELSAESDDTIEFPSFDDTVAMPTSADSFLDATISDSDDLNDVLTMDELDGAIGSSDDLTLDLDQLSGDLELDSAELMNPDLGNIDLPELSMANDFDTTDVAARSASNDAGAMETMLDLAKAYIDMGDKDSASNTLDEIVKGGNPAQVTEAETLLRKIS